MSPPPPAPTDAQALLLDQISEVMRTVDRAVADREQSLPGLLRRAKDAGVPVPELAALTGYTRQYIYRLLADAAETDERDPDPV